MTAVPAASGRAQKLHGAGKAAALVLAMGKQHAGRVFKHLEAAEIQLIMRRATELGPVPVDAIVALVDEFNENFSNGPHLIGSPEEVQKLLTGVIPPEQIMGIIGETVEASYRSIWDRVSGMSESALATYLAKEHPQTAAFVLSKLKPSCASKVMTQWPEETRHDLMRRMLNLKPVAEQPTMIIEKALYEDFTLNLARNKGADTHARMADILNKMESRDMEAALDSLQRVRPESAEMLKGLLFTFEDIAQLPARSRTAIFDQASPENVVLALRGTEPHFREIMLSSLASRARRIVQNELDNGEPALQREVLEARRAITDLALDMASRGEIELNPEREEGAYFQ
ncbi:MAG: flagellar motor switch protein FliG [Bosea sp.]|uniref:flagellar motor switch protein FliG n=1 Tax=Bosea sp. (in: a-proteobacteria) TaxID=1871050 RepID=UPI0023939C59|nr:flagellar motor switch protein FliG [Bosea sp. (in: a-proteobacteria)]MCP4737754.1 flagellar motor switch protein FliG [Bosea sp. (in: a-proteobacteria)]